MSNFDLVASLIACIFLGLTIGVYIGYTIGYCKGIMTGCTYQSIINSDIAAKLHDLEYKSAVTKEEE